MDNKIASKAIASRIKKFQQAFYNKRKLGGRPVERHIREIWGKRDTWMIGLIYVFIGRGHSNLKILLFCCYLLIEIYFVI